jgi:conjugative transfer signal peptidase TraF
VSQRECQRRRRRRLARIGVVIGAAIIVAGAVFGDRQILYNTSESVPLGLYIRTGASTTPGAIIAYRPPAAAQAYVEAHLPFYLRWPLLKPVVGVPGDMACRNPGGLFSVNGRTLGRAQECDSQGAPLPQWHGCRELGAGEVVTFSERVPNSFDSRYYGPVPSENVLGVYAPLLTW